ncbi:MAG: hypothetical protein HQM10_06015 [Candidatus Riflebacteria bacterium]|nr:hypothetical protein [Candidatus Riflebacteria bacterium]
MSKKTRAISISEVIFEEAKDFNTKTYHLFVIVAGLIVSGLVTAFAKKLTFHLGIPGHSAILWLGSMIACRNIIGNKGAGTLIGISTALWGVPMGLNNAVIYNIGLYGAAGIVLDLIAMVPQINTSKVTSAVLSGIAAHAMKFCFLVCSTLSSTVIKKFVLFGFLQSAFLHVFFGAIAGLTGILGYSIFQQLFQKKRTSDQ